MNKIINGKRYDTDKAELVFVSDNGLLAGDLDYYCETLYRKRTGEFFIHMDGGPRSVCARPDGTGIVGGEYIRPISYDEARLWAEGSMTADGYDKWFGDPESGTAAINLFVSASAKAKLEREASRTGKTQSAIIEELIGTL